MRVVQLRFAKRFRQDLAPDCRASPEQSYFVPPELQLPVPFFEETKFVLRFSFPAQIFDAPVVSLEACRIRKRPAVVIEGMQPETILFDKNKVEDETQTTPLFYSKRRHYWKQLPEIDNRPGEDSYSRQHGAFPRESNLCRSRPFCTGT